MLALPSGTIPIIAGLSGAGERIPALAHDASSPGSCLSNSPTRNPARASSRAIEPPIRPPPAIATSNVFMERFYRNRLQQAVTRLALQNLRLLKRTGKVL